VSRTSAILPANRLGTVLSSEVFADPMRAANMARFVFLNPKLVTSFAREQLPGSSCSGVIV
jgi:hypothetical protein